MTIELRKPEVCCLNGNTYNRVVGYSLCNCTTEDFEWQVLKCVVYAHIHTLTVFYR